MKMRSLLHVLPLLLVVLSFQACADATVPEAGLAEKDRLVREFKASYEALRALPVPPPIIADGTERQAMLDKRLAQLDQYQATVQAEIERRQAAGIDDRESFERFVEEAEAAAFTDDVRAYMQQFKELDAPRRQLQADADEKRKNLVPFFPELQEMGPLDAYEWLEANGAFVYVVDRKN